MPAYPLYLVFSAAAEFAGLLAYPMLAVYYLTIVGLNPFQLALVGIVYQITVLLGEVPTGVLADAYSRRRSVQLGMALVGAGFLTEGLWPRLEGILLAQVVRGLGQTFLSGATTAWIADEVGEARMAHALVRGAQARQVGVMLGVLVCAVIANFAGAQVPVIASGLGYLAVAVALLLFMPENGFRPVPRSERASWRALTETLRAGLQLVRQRPPLLALLGAAAFLGVQFEGLDRFWEAHFVQDHTLPLFFGFAIVTWFSVFNLGAMASDLTGTLFASRALRHPQFTVEGALLALYAATGVGMLAFGLVPQFGAAVAAFWALCLFGGAARPIHEIWLNRHITSNVRATVLSLHSQTQALGQLLGGLLLGLIATQFSIGLALALAGALIFPALWFLWQSGRQVVT